MEDYTTSEKCLTYLMRIYSILFLVAGYVFLLFPWYILKWIDSFTENTIILWFLGENALFKWLGWQLGHGRVNAQQDIPVEYFWVFLSFSMMMTIAACSYISSKDVRKNRSVIVPIILSKLASSLCALIFYYSRGILAHLVIFITDFPLFLLTLYLYLKAQNGRIPEVYQSQEIDKDKYREMCIGSENTKVACICNEDKITALNRVLEETGFYDILERKWKDSGKKKEHFLIAVKPNLMMTYNKIDESTYTDPKLVEHLLNKLNEREYTRLALVESRNTYGLYFKKRGVEDVARYVGYQGKNYKICDLTDKDEMKKYDYGGSLGRHFVGKTWRDADFRISFAKNKTHSFCYYTLTLKNTYGTLPLENKLFEYHKKREVDWPTIEALKHFPVHYGIIDAFISADGPMGVISDVRPKYTKTLIGGEKIVAVDWVGAQKMGLNPLKSRFMKIAVHEFGSPEGKIELIGDDTPYLPWKNVNPFLVDILDVAEEWWVFCHSFMSTFIFAEEYFPRKPMSIVFRFFRWLILPILPLFFRTDHRLRKSRRRL